MMCKLHLGNNALKTVNMISSQVIGPKFQAMKSQVLGSDWGVSIFQPAIHMTLVLHLVPSICDINFHYFDI